MENEEFVYIHTVQYYETDAMQIVHHSNYIRWMEEARLDYLKTVGLEYSAMEDSGVIIPVLSVDCQYKIATRYGEQVKIFPKIESFNGLKFTVTYRITDLEEKVLHATGSSTHCFLDHNLRPVNVKKCAPAIYEHFAMFKK